SWAPTQKPSGALPERYPRTPPFSAKPPPAPLTSSSGDPRTYRLTAGLRAPSNSTGSMRTPNIDPPIAGSGWSLSTILCSPPVAGSFSCRGLGIPRTSSLVVVVELWLPPACATGPARTESRISEFRMKRTEFPLLELRLPAGGSRIEPGPGTYEGALGRIHYRPSRGHVPGQRREGLGHV